MDELVATDRTAYVDLAVRLCSNSTLRLETAARLAERSEKLFGDLAPVRALEQLLREAAR
jgi:predicted O-linked N-acetylglucosamine transferase (SPINDLY family)